MFISTVRPAQAELQAHRRWLQSFVSNWSDATRQSSCNGAIRRTFSNSPRPGEGQRQHRKTQFVGKPRTEWQKRRRENQIAKKPVNLEALSVRHDLLEAVKEYDLKNTITLYAQLPEYKPLTPDTVRAIAQCIHQCLRQDNQKPPGERRREDLDEIVAFAINLVKDIRVGRTLPDVQAHVHLLGIFRESGSREAGIRFWQWLETQDEQYLNHDVYALAIELLAVNGSPLEELEKLYEQALARFPGAFLAYHLSPDAILTDRKHEPDVKDVPMLLLQAITFARLLRGDSRRAYLALDTAFRLFPSSVHPRFLGVFEAERSTSEVYSIFAMACRGGVQISHTHVKTLMGQLRKQAELKSMHAHFTSLRAMLAALYFQISSSGQVGSNSVAELVIVTTQILRLPGVTNLHPNQRRTIVDAIFGTVSRTFEVFARYGAVPTIATFNSLISNVAGYGQKREAIEVALSDMAVLGIEKNEVTRRCIMTAAGLLEDADLLMETWESVIEARQRAKQKPDALDLNIFVVAATKCGKAKDAQAAFDTFKSAIPTKHHSRIERQLEITGEKQSKGQAARTVDVDELQRNIKMLSGDLAIIDEATKDRPALLDLNNQVLPMTIVSPPRYLSMPETEMRKLYDEVTTDQTVSPRGPNSEIQSEETSDTPEPSVNPTGSLKTPLISPTMIDFGTLRYENWRTINYLLWLAEKHDQEYAKVVDEAIASGKKPPKRNLGFAEDESTDSSFRGLTECNSQNWSEESKVWNAGEVEAARRAILRLRRKD